MIWQRGTCVIRQHSGSRLETNQQSKELYLMVSNVTIVHLVGTENLLDHSITGNNRSRTSCFGIVLGWSTTRYQIFDSRLVGVTQRSFWTAKHFHCITWSHKAGLVRNNLRDIGSNLCKMVLILFLLYRRNSPNKRNFTSQNDQLNEETK